MKRQKRSDDGPTTEEEVAFTVLKADDRATVVLRCSPTPNRIAMVNDAARSLLSDILTDESLQPEFWRAVDGVGRSGEPSESSLKSGENIILAKLRRVVLSEKSYIVVTAKKIQPRPTETPHSNPFLPPSTSDESVQNTLDLYTEAIENDFISQVAGMDSIYLALTSGMTEEGTVTFHAVNRNVAHHFGCPFPFLLRGKTSLDVGMSPTDILQMGLTHARLYDPATQRSSYTYTMMGMNMYCENKTICSGVNLSLIIAHPSGAERPLPLKLDPSQLIPTNQPVRKWNKHQWE
ncbi:hypothetical protein PROFUN_16944, partial [Planoprotostelium fungivorum]